MIGTIIIGVLLVFILLNVLYSGYLIGADCGFDKLPTKKYLAHNNKVMLIVVELIFLAASLITMIASHMEAWYICFSLVIPIILYYMSFVNIKLYKLIKFKKYNKSRITVLFIIALIVTILYIVGLIFIFNKKTEYHSYKAILVSEYVFGAGATSTIFLLTTFVLLIRKIFTKVYEHNYRDGVTKRLIVIKESFFHIEKNIYYFDNVSELKADFSNEGNFLVDEGFSSLTIYTTPFGVTSYRLSSI